MNEKKHPICFAPWTHSYRGPRGQRALCCEAESFTAENESSFSEYWNGTTLKKIRQQMLTGSIPKETCKACLDLSQNSSPLYNRFKMDKSQSENILKNTNADGFYSGEPNFLDYRVDNLCNLSCRTCGPDYSSKIEDQLPDNNRIKKELKVKIAEEFEEIAFNESINELYFASGEAFVQKDHWEFLNKLANKREVSNIDLEYNTNLQFSLKTIEKNETVLKKFKSVGLCISIDGNEKTGEFIRDGLEWNRLVRNIDYCMRSSIFTVKSFDVTLTLPGLLEVEELIKFLKEYRTPINLRMVTPGGYAKLLSPYLLEKTRLLTLLDNKLKIISADRNIISIPFITLLYEMKQKILSGRSPVFDKEEIASSYRYSKELDAKFKRTPLCDFYSQYTETKDIFSEFKEDEVVAPTIDGEVAFWNHYIRSNISNKNVKISLFPDTKTIESLFHNPQESIITVSYPSILSRLLNIRKSKKYEELNFLEMTIDLKKIELIESNTVPLLSYLSREKDRPLLKLLNPFLRNKLFSLHKVYYIKS